LKDLLIFLEHGVAAQELKYLLNDVGNFFFDLVEYPLIEFTRGKNSGILEVDQVSRRFRLGKLEYLLQVGNAHLAIGKNKVQDTQAGGVGTRPEDLRPRLYIKVL
jgi:hypothetical protein